MDTTKPTLQDRFLVDGLPPSLIEVTEHVLNAPRRVLLHLAAIVRLIDVPKETPDTLAFRFDRVVVLAPDGHLVVSAEDMVRVRAAWIAWHEATWRGKVV